MEKVEEKFKDKTFKSFNFSNSIPILLLFYKSYCLTNGAVFNPKHRKEKSQDDRTIYELVCVLQNINCKSGLGDKKCGSDKIAYNMYFIYSLHRYKFVTFIQNTF